nr:GAF and ANTAR domain-containing protein [Phytoactinopolyspora alkaliphila]
MSSAATRLVDGAMNATGADAGVLLLRCAGRWDMAAASSVGIGWIDLEQHRLGHGPGVYAVREKRALFATGIGDDQRWPEWSRLANRRGVHAVTAACLHTPGRVLGTLSVYAEKATLGPDSVQAVAPLADWGAAILEQLITRTGCHEVVDDSPVVAEAQRLLMERHGLSARNALELLQCYAQEGGADLIEVAERLVVTCDRVPGGGTSHSGRRHDVDHRPFA